MKIVKITHYRGDEGHKTSESIWFESSDVEAIKRRAQMVVNHSLPVYEGLTLVAQGINEKGIPWKTFAEGSSEYSYWVRVEVRP